MGRKEGEGDDGAGERGGWSERERWFTVMLYQRVGGLNCRQDFIVEQIIRCGRTES